jgi:hypothetical protein
VRRGLLASLLCSVCAAQLLVATAPAAVPQAEAAITVKTRAALVATIRATCARCDWSRSGQEAIMLRVMLDDRYSQHVTTVRAGEFDYRILLGTVDPGSHRVHVAVDAARSPASLRTEDSVALLISSLTASEEGSVDYEALAHAPFVYERANTAGRFSDVPVFMWYEIEPTTDGSRYRYSVIFTNEDGGTPADRLMATWGRTTDIEYVYSVEVGGDGRILAHDYQGPDHEVLPYRAPLEQQRPRLWVVTDNNMVLDRGETNVRFSPAPLRFDLASVSREVVMDAHSWLYAVAAQELIREGKIVANAPPGRGTIPDPREFLYFEGCGTLGGGGLTFAAQVGNRWISTDRDVSEYRIARDGCFRGALPLPPPARVTDVKNVRVQAFERTGKPPAGPARVTDVRMFVLDAHYAPTAPRLQWRGNAELRPGGPPHTIAVP